MPYTKDKFHLFATYFHNYNKRKVLEEFYLVLKSDNGEWRDNLFLPYVYSNNAEQISTGFDYSLNFRKFLLGHNDKDLSVY